MQFRDRLHAAEELAQALESLNHLDEAVVLGLPRGGVVLAKVIAKKFSLPLDIEAPRKIGAPDNPELALGAIGEKGTGFFDQELIAAYGIDQNYLDTEIEKERQEISRRLTTYRDGKPALDLKNKTVIIVDDGIATGATMMAAVRSVKAKGATKVIVAVPVGAADSVAKIKKEANVIICLDQPWFFVAIGNFYDSFEQVNDQEVIDLLKNP